MRRYPFSMPLELSLVKETEAGRQEGDDRSRFVNFRLERVRRAWLVVVFQKAGQFVLIVYPSPKMLSHRAGMAVAQAVVESLIVGIVEPLLLQRPFQVPVNLGHEAETRRLLAHTLRCLGPKGFGLDTPGTLKDVG